ncbi:dockerin type I domain-containing protein [Mucisphaera calidilacus]|uniref:Dockerin domain-containing protein n=1 Tax=Mucisphaera calidilacus TaxID=2527982 RepID=A0A518BVE7_9BACT|nr:dockerin type I domain-containing protein [Mucisphaera calidilacus]QDU70946.1 hypothetical protein Pan265_07900 [Mucisphaera calidilacus]
MRSTTIAGFASAFALAAVAQGQIFMDGYLEPGEYGSALSVQNTNTGFGDSNLAMPEFANGSEIDAVYGTVANDTLYLMVTGNLESNFNKMVFMVDSVAGGVNQLLNDPEDPLPDLDFGEGGFLNGLRSMSGITFDEGFEADYMVAVTHGTENIDDFTSGWLLSTHFAELKPQSQNPAAGYAGGISSPGVQGVDSVFVDASNADPGTTPIEQFYITPSGGRPAADNSAFGIQASINNLNAFEEDDFGTVTAGGVFGNGETDEASPELIALAEQVTTGVEVAIPLSTIGNPTGDIKVHIHINGSNYSYLSNQVNGVGVLQGNLGGDGAGGFIGGADPLSGIDFNNFDGLQYDVIANGSGPVPGDANGDGVVDLLDLSILASNFEGTDTPYTNEEGDFNGDGLVDLLDLSILASNFESTPAPEPAGAALIGLGAVALLRRR